MDDTTFTPEQIEAARKRVNDLTVPDEMLERAAALCLHLGTDGLRGELTLEKSSKRTVPGTICFQKRSSSLFLLSVNFFEVGEVS
jgi:hypothetical protein